MVADLPARRVRTDLVDDAGTLVAAGERQHPRREVTGGEVVVGVAQTRSDHRQTQLALARLVDLDVDDLPRAGHLVQDRSPCSHPSPLTLVPTFPTMRT